MPALHRTPRILQRSLTKALIVAGLLVTCIAPSAHALIYWANQVNGLADMIGAANLDGTVVNRSFITGASEPRGVAVDGTHVYWANGGAASGTASIARANLDGTDVNQDFITPPLFGTSPDLRAVAVNGTHVFWTDLNQSTIGRANLDGTDATDGFIRVGVVGLVDPLGVAVDGTYIYWTAFRTNSIGRANLDGTGVNLSFVTGADGPNSVAVDATHIYWVNGLTNMIGRANLDGTSVNQDFITGGGFLSNVNGIAVSPVPEPIANTIDWIPVGNPGNAPDTAINCFSTNCGSVAYNYRISTYDVTNAQYAEFLNAKAASDPNPLYEPNMGSDPINGGITQSGSSGSYTYGVKPGFANMPVTYVSFWSALRFANWLNNGQGSGDTETGAYTITADGIAANSITRNPGATMFLPSENEWYKAADYNPNTSTYFAYPTYSDTPTVCAAPGATPNTANCGAAAGNTVTATGAYARSASPYGTFDQGGNVYQWNEQIMGSYRSIRGGFWGVGPQGLAASYPPQVLDPTARGTIVGFRVATLAADPPSGCGMGGEMALALPLLMWLRSRRRRCREVNGSVA